MTSWLSGWQYRKSHEIQGSTAGAVTDYQIRIKVHYGSGVDDAENVYLNGKCRTDFGDIRFCDSDGVTELPYWMEEKVDGDYAIFWVKVPSIPASPDTATIYVYYGNPSATTTSNGDNTFLFFDHFLGTSLDASKWSVYGSGSVTVADSICEIIGGGGVREQIWSLTGFSPPKAFMFRVKDASKGSGIYQHHGCRHEETVDDEEFGVSNYAGLSERFWSKASNAYSYQTFDLVFTDWRRVELKWRSGELKLDIDFGTITKTKTDNIPSVDQHLWFSTDQDSPDYIIYIDWCLVRKYVDPEPSHGAWGSEETVAVTLSVLVSNESLDKSRGIAGETVTYTATVQDENGNALPSTFKVTLKIDDTILIQDQPLTSDVYNPTTKTLTLQWTVPAMNTFHTVKLVWSEQTVNTTTYSAGESSGVQFEIIPISPEQFNILVVTLISVAIIYPIQTAREYMVEEER